MSTAEDHISGASGMAEQQGQGPWLSGLREGYAEIGDVRLHYVEAGDGPLIVLLAETTRPCSTDDALGIEARCRALLTDSATAEETYRESIDRLSRTNLRPELARVHLLYGEWLRRKGRRGDAREQLRTAYHMCVAIGMKAFDERARRELTATGEKLRKSADQIRDQLTRKRSR